MTVHEFADDLLPLGTKLTLRWTNKPRQKLNRPRTVVGRKINVPGIGRELPDGNGLYLARPDGKVVHIKWPQDHCIEITGTGFAFYRNGRRYVEYDFVKEELGDGFD